MRASSLLHLRRSNSMCSCGGEAALPRARCLVLLLPSRVAVSAPLPSVTWCSRCLALVCVHTYYRDGACSSVSTGLGVGRVGKQRQRGRASRVFLDVLLNIEIYQDYDYGGWFMCNGNGYRAPHWRPHIARPTRLVDRGVDEGSRHTQGSPGSFSLATTLLPLCGCGARSRRLWRAGGDQQPSRAAGRGRRHL